MNVFIPGIKLNHKLLNEYPGIFKPYQIGDSEGTLLFDEDKLPEVAEILKPVITGKNISPKSKRNIRFVQKVALLTRKAG